MLEIKNLHVRINGKKILDGINLKIQKSQTHFIFGPNGSGKSTLAKTIMGIGDLEIERGEILFDTENLLKIPINLRAKKGIFLANQYPPEIEGVNFADFLKIAYEKRFDKKITVSQFIKILESKLELLDFDKSFINRNLNEGFSGGEKKKAEILQLLILQPKLAILDETDSGLDIDAVKIVFEALGKIKENNKDMALLIITHSDKVLQFLQSDFVHIIRNGKIIKSGDSKLAKEIFQTGFRLN